MKYLKYQSTLSAQQQDSARETWFYGDENAIEIDFLPYVIAADGTRKPDRRWVTVSYTLAGGFAVIANNTAFVTTKAPISINPGMSDVTLLPNRVGLANLQFDHHYIVSKVVDF